MANPTWQEIRECGPAWMRGFRLTQEDIDAFVDGNVYELVEAGRGPVELMFDKEAIDYWLRHEEDFADDDDGEMVVTWDTSSMPLGMFLRRHMLDRFRWAFYEAVEEARRVSL